VPFLFVYEKSIATRSFEDGMMAEPDPHEGNLRETVDAREAGSVTPRRIGHFHIKRLLASGGMGTVYEAVQEHPRRVVALKVMRRGLASKSAFRRFEYESQILARLHHPCVAQVYDAGQHVEGGDAVPYFAMEYIPGAKSLTEYAEKQQLNQQQRLELFAKVCEAVHHGHQKGIIHRDLKPSNILVNADGEPKVIDFGVARSSDSDMALTGEQTAVGEMVGTLKYMSPEQCEADPHNIDTRSDVYSLGVVLYELLSGHLPHAFDDTPIYKVPRLILEVPPTRLSQWDRSLRGDLEVIVAKALEKKRDMRYQSAMDFARDVRRYVNCEPILARPPSVFYRTRKLVRRRRVPIVLTLAFIALTAAIADRQVRSRRASAFRHYYQALSHAERGKNEVALSECTAAIALNSGFAPALALRCKLFALEENIDRALEDCEQAASIDPANALAQRTLGFLYLEKGRFDDALRAFDQGIRPGLASHELAEDFHNRARLRRRAGRFAEAIADHNRAIALAPKIGHPFQGRGLTLYMMGNADGAVESWKRAASLHEDLRIQAAFWTWEVCMIADQPRDRTKCDSALAEAKEDVEPHPDAFLAWQLFLGEDVEADLIKTAKTPEDKCQTFYNLGVRALVDERFDDARRWFASAIKTKAHRLPEFDLATWHLTKLESAPTPPSHD
jgi:serine/threonine protein kinase/Tfp pilus assembly protein PilF